MGKKLKIIEFLGGLSAGGAESVIKDYSLELKKRGHEVLIPVYYSNYTSPIQKEVLENNIRVKVFRGEYNSSFISRVYNKILTLMGHNKRSIKRVILDFKPDVIHLHGYTLLDFEYLDRELDGISLVYTCHNPPQEFFLGRWTKQFDIAKRLIQEKGMKLIALHEEMANELNEMFEINSTRVLYNPINFDRFKVSQELRSETRKRIGIPQEAFVIGNVGRIVHQKNHSFLIDVFNEVIKQKPESVLVIIAGSDGDLYPEVLEKIKVNRLEEKVLILFNRKDMPELYSMMDVFVMTSHFEGFCIAFVEAQIMGLKCVVSLGIPREASFSDKVFRLSLKDNPQVWADYIINQKVFKNSHIKKDLEALRIEHIVDLLIEIYQE